MAVSSGRNKVFKLIARGTTLDLFDDETIFLSNNVTGLFDIGELPSDFTRQIQLPGTKKNNDFFQHVYDISVDEPYLFKTNEKVIAQFDFDGFYVAQGYMQLENVVVKENKFIESYTVSVFGLLSSFSRDLAQINLTNLDTLDKYNHTASIEVVLETWSGSAADADIVTNSGSFEVGDIIYPIVDYGQGYTFQSATTDNNFGIDNPDGDFSGGQINIIDLKPMIRTKRVVEAIFSQSQYTFESDFFDSDMFNDQYILCDNGNKRANYSGIDLNIEGLAKFGPISGSSVPLTLTTSGVSESLDFENTIFDPSFKMSGSSYQMSDNWGVDGTSYSMPVEMEINLNYLVTGSDSVVSIPNLSLFFRENPQSGSFQGPIVHLDFMNEQMYRRLTGKAGTGEEQFQLEQKIIVFLARGVTYDTQIFINGFQTGNTSADVIIGPGGNAESYIEVQKLTQIADYRIMQIPPNMPFATKGITSLEFLQGLQKKYNLQIYPSKTKPRHFIIKQFNDWYKEGKVVDIDSMVDLNKKITVTPANNLGVKNLEFGDTLDVDFLSQNFSKTNNREYGKTYYTDTQNFFSQGELKVQTTMSSSPLRYVGGSGVIGTGALTQGTPFQGYPGGTANQACNGISCYTFYHNGSFTEPTVGDTIFQDANMTIPMFMAPFMQVCGTPEVLSISLSSGVVLSIGLCSGGGGPTS
jgi:hypothetical protein